MTIQAPGEPVPALLEKYSGFSFEESCGLLMVIFRIIYHRTYNNSYQCSDTCTNRNRKKVLKKHPCQHTYATTDNKSC